LCGLQPKVFTVHLQLLNACRSFSMQTWIVAGEYFWTECNSRHATWHTAPRTLKRRAFWPHPSGACSTHVSLTIALSKPFLPGRSRLSAPAFFLGERSRKPTTERGTLTFDPVRLASGRSKRAAAIGEIGRFVRAVIFRTRQSLRLLARINPAPWRSRLGRKGRGAQLSYRR